MTLCKFFLQGNCRNGAACRFEHRAPQLHEAEYNEWRRNNPSSFGGGNIFGSSTDPDANHATRKGWSEQIIYDSLKTEHPLWPFTSFGAPYFRSLISADLSFEEYHLAAIEAQRNGTFPQWQQECDQRLAEIKRQEENVLNNLKEAWQYNVNEPYYPSGKTENGNSFGALGSQQSSFGNMSTSTFGVGSGSSSFGNTSSFNKPAASGSFGASPFGSMPASAFSLGSRDAAPSNPPPAFGSTPSAFGGGTTTSAFGQPTSAFGSALSTSAFSANPPTSAFGTQSTTPSFGSNTSSTLAFGNTSSSTPAFGSTTSTFGAKPSAFGGSSLPPGPMSSFGSTPTFGQTSSLGASQPVFGQTSTLGAGGLPPPPGAGFGASQPKFGQAGGLGVLGGGTSAPTFGQASSFSSPFAGGLGKALGASMGTFGAKSTFGSFGQDTTNAFAQAAGTGQPNAFIQAAQNNSGANAFGTTNENRFAALTDATPAGKEEEMADEATPREEKPAPFGVPSTTTTATATATPSTPGPPVPPRGSLVPPVQPPPVPPREPIVQPASTPPSTTQPPTSTSDLSDAFGGLSTTTPKPATPTAAAAAKPTPPAPAPPVPQPSTSSVAAPRLTSLQVATTVDAMAAWMAAEFTIGQIPEIEPPVNVRA